LNYKESPTPLEPPDANSEGLSLPCPNIVSTRQRKYFIFFPIGEMRRGGGALKKKSQF